VFQQLVKSHVDLSLKVEYEVESHYALEDGKREIYDEKPCEHESVYLLFSAIKIWELAHAAWKLWGASVVFML
jgi:hypothetical protein